ALSDGDPVQACDCRSGLFEMRSGVYSSDDLRSGLLNRKTEVTMRKPRGTWIGALGITIAGVAFMPASITGQARPNAPKAASASTLPRMLDGHPDLQGMYDIATITPLERPAGVNGRLSLTAKEVADLERAEQNLAT